MTPIQLNGKLGSVDQGIFAEDILRWEVNGSGAKIHFRDRNREPLEVTETVTQVSAAIRNSGYGTYLEITDGVTAPGAGTGVARIYVDTADGDLKVAFADGFVRIIGADS
jgi:hypothetical protein